jgi:N-dimethylarginine dimethylaminohydrolase
MTDAMQPSPHILMCPPDYYGIEYEINPWMNRRRAVDRALAVQQWQHLRDLLENAGATVSCLHPVRGLPDLVFTANAGLVCGDMTILSRFRHSERQREEPQFRRWFSDHGFRVYGLKAQASFEGAGDALFCGDTLFAGYRIRSDVQAHQELGEVLGCRVVPLELVHPRYYHLDTCFCPLTSDAAIYYAGAFDEYGRRVLHQWIPDLIGVSSREARRWACNAVVVAKTVVTGSGCPELHRQLRDRGFTAYETPLDEFIKSGGSAKCLTLRMDGEDAASWRTQPPLHAGGAT